MTSLQILKLPQMFLSHCIPMDLTALSIESFLRDLKPHFVFHDFTHWLQWRLQEFFSECSLRNIIFPSGNFKCIIV